MAKRDKLFSIGDISRFTGTSIKSLRYYEEINILEPAFVDPDSNYRYYSFDQIYLVNIIQFCIEMDIPLKKLACYIDKNEMINLSDLLAYGKEIAEKKLKTLLQGLQFIEDVKHQIALTEKHRQHDVYSREIPEKLFYLIPHNLSLKNADIFELSKPFLEMEHNGKDLYEYVEYGYLYEYSPAGLRKFAFMEVPRHMEAPKPRANGSLRLIPGGCYFCRQSESIQIEQAHQLFSTHLNGKNSFLAIETEIFAGKFKVNKPIQELRLIAQNGKE